ncbi:hypothetical protein RP20_CCG012865 [Aedes albopictus]|nr:hypothetical protein RP20_CCG012865 [Aedes albopictus]
MKNHRSLEGYRKYEAGFVSSVSGQMINNSYIVLAKVLHSMKIRDTVLKPWTIINMNGNILFAHCDCVAGFSETCSHVSAALYFLANLHAQTVDRRVLYFNFTSHDIVYCKYYERNTNFNCILLLRIVDHNDIRKN